MRRINAVITIGLAIAAAAAWFVVSAVPGKITPTFPDVQVPFAVTLSAAACVGWLLL
jgi:hypothetical protein